jgi:hypothetical protein
MRELETSTRGRKGAEEDMSGYPWDIPGISVLQKIFLRYP